MSDLHLGIKSCGLDGAEWLARAVDDLDDNFRTIDYGLTLGDITHYGDRRSLTRYLELRDKSSIPTWFELAGNHEHHKGGIANFTELVRAPVPYIHIDGNVVWIFLSDENKHRPGHLSERSRQWLSEKLELHRNKVVILCSHQSPPHTVRRSDEDFFSLHPRAEISKILDSHPVALHLCGHEHHHPYDKGCIYQRVGTSVINVASINHAYETDGSGSLLIELVDGARQIVARRRSHDRSAFRKRFEVRVPLRKRISLAPRRRVEEQGPFGLPARIGARFFKPGRRDPRR